MGEAPALDETTRSFVRRAMSAGLVEIDELKKVVVSLMADSPQFTAQRLADGLVAAGILTPWQQAKLLAGKSKGFYLGSYRLLRPLGKGGMGVVYLGEHHVKKRLVALKILPPEASRDQRRIARFKEETRACAQLDHTHIVRAYGFSEAGGKLYFVMEYVDGIDLQQAVARDGVMAFSDAMDLLIQATQGLAHAHQRGIIHRNIKPSNLLLRSDGTLKVSDLGLARIGWSTDEQSEKRRLMGTADFVSPEQAINSTAVDARTDIYSLGCNLFFLLTGRSPYQRDTVAERLAEHQTAPIPDIRTYRRDCPAAIAELAMRMMAKRPEDRPKSAIELLSQLTRLSGLACDASMVSSEVWQEVDIAEYLGSEDDADRNARYESIRQRHDARSSENGSESDVQVDTCAENSDEDLSGSASDQSAETSRGRDSRRNTGIASASTAQAKPASATDSSRRRPVRPPKQKRFSKSGPSRLRSLGDLDRLKTIGAIVLTIFTVGCLGYSGHRYYNGPQVRVLEGID